MTKKEMFAEIRNIIIDNEEMVAFIDHEIELLERKSNSPKKPTKVQLENDAFKAEIVAYLTTADTPKTIKEMQSEITSISGLTNQRITHMLTDLVKAETLTKEYVKKTPYYSIAQSLIKWGVKPPLSQKTLDKAFGVCYNNIIKRKER